MAISSLLIPAAFHASLGTTDISNDGLLEISRGTSVILLVVYGMFYLHLDLINFRYLYFQLKSHSSLYDEIASSEIGAEIEYATIPPRWAVGL